MSTAEISQVNYGSAEFKPTSVNQPERNPSFQDKSANLAHALTDIKFPTIKRDLQYYPFFIINRQLPDIYASSPSVSEEKYAEFPSDTETNLCHTLRNANDERLSPDEDTQAQSLLLKLLRTEYFQPYDAKSLIASAKGVHETLDPFQEWSTDSIEAGANLGLILQDKFKDSQAFPQAYATATRLAAIEAWARKKPLLAFGFIAIYDRTQNNKNSLGNLVETMEIAYAVYPPKLQEQLDAELVNIKTENVLPIDRSNKRHDLVTLDMLKFNAQERHAQRVGQEILSWCRSQKFFSDLDFSESELGEQAWRTYFINELKSWVNDPAQLVWLESPTLPNQPNLDPVRNLQIEVMKRIEPILDRYLVNAIAGELETRLHCVIIDQDLHFKNYKLRRSIQPNHNIQDFMSQKDVFYKFKNQDGTAMSTADLEAQIARMSLEDVVVESRISVEQLDYIDFIYLLKDPQAYLERLNQGIDQGAFRGFKDRKTLREQDKRYLQEKIVEKFLPAVNFLQSLYQLNQFNEFNENMFKKVITQMGLGNIVSEAKLQDVSKQLAEFFPDKHFFSEFKDDCCSKELIQSDKKIFNEIYDSYWEVRHKIGNEVKVKAGDAFYRVFRNSSFLLDGLDSCEKARNQYRSKRNEFVQRLGKSMGEIMYQVYAALNEVLIHRRETEYRKQPIHNNELEFIRNIPTGVAARIYKQLRNYNASDYLLRLPQPPAGE